MTRGRASYACDNNPANPQTATSALERPAVAVQCNVKSAWDCFVRYAASKSSCQRLHYPQHCQLTRLRHLLTPVSHDMRFDRIFCLTCDAEERELHRQRQRGSSTPFGSPPQSSPPSGYGFGPDYNYRGNQNIGVWFSEDSNSSADGNGMNIDS
jgi:hypothetical protein